ncbi:MAG: ATPase, T2SS/T4P/T4SS family [Calditrichia bacterium]
MEVQTVHNFKDKWLADALLKNGIIETGLFEELAARFVDEEYFMDILIDNDLLSYSEIALFIKDVLQIPVVNLDQVTIQPEVIELIPEKICLKYKLIPFKIEEDQNIKVAYSNPFDLVAEKELGKVTGKYIQTCFAFKDQIQRKFEEYYSPGKFIDSIVDKAQIHKEVRIEGEETLETDSTVVKLLNIILADSIEKEASDIHIEPKEKIVQVRFRIDGVLRNILEVPKSAHPALISRIKIISNLNIAETRKPQDGKSKIYVDDHDVDLRVSILPTNFGEKAVIRILDKRKAAVSFNQLGIRGNNLHLLEQCFEFKQGIVLVTGPTGSGKTTTLYAALNRIRSTTNNILTIEDPIEYMIEGINQVQVNEKAGVTFATALRSFLRQDPDVILVGEIRDRETAEIAVQAAMTGHLVLSTLHTNDTFSSITRLVDMGVDATKVAEAVQAIIAQRLVRKLCQDCRQERKPTDKEKALIPLMEKIGLAPRFYQSNGCRSCGFVGYKGRVGIYEILILNDMLRSSVSSNASASQLRLKAREKGFRGLYDDALSLVADGITDYEEVLRVINPGMEFEDDTPGADDPMQITKTSSSTHNNNVSVQSGMQFPSENVKADGSVDIMELSRKVLLVEDSKDMRVLLKRLIEKKTKWKLFEAEDGLQAMEIVARMRPDVIVLDVMMPNMDGFEFLKRIRSDLSTATIPVLMLTALTETDNEIKGLELGADDYLGKPFNAKILFARIKRLLLRSPSLIVNQELTTKSVNGSKSESNLETIEDS